MKSPSAIRRAADAIEASAIGDHKDAVLTLLARAAERYALGTLQPDEVEALARLMAG